MTVRVAINGFGRIGRLALRALAESGRNDVSVVAINGHGTPADNEYMLKYDSVHGVFAHDVVIDGDLLKTAGQTVKMIIEDNPAKLPWKDLGVDVVFECTGKYNSRDKAAVHLEAGAKRVLVSAPADGADLTVVYGVNHDQLTAAHKVVSNGSCTTNCLAPVAKVLQDLAGIEHGFMTTIHSYTRDQHTVDTRHKDHRRGRAAAVSMIPTSTGAAKAIGLVIPELAGKLDGSSIRVPTPNVSVVDLAVVTKRPVTKDEINQAMLAAAAGPMKGVLGVNKDECVSVDFNHNPISSVYDLTQTKVIDGTFVRVLAWYDNEWAFSCRMLDVAAALGKLG
ncbi:MAG: type I glyceraldehyde-3-phosphate dehydrogenase [Rhodospirillaceae bacterium]|nr:type I glyceraldehyde-3-phosphate dehydrogenase [Rhodospirillaceae bacterium]